MNVALLSIILFSNLYIRLIKFKVMFNTPLFIHVFGFGFVYITIICDVNMAQ